MKEKLKGMGYDIIDIKCLNCGTHPMIKWRLNDGSIEAECGSCDFKQKPKKRKQIKTCLQKRIDYLKSIDYSEFGLRCATYCLDCNEAVLDHVSYNPNDYTEERLKDHNPEQKRHALKEQTIELKWLEYAKEKGIEINKDNVREDGQYAFNELHNDHTTFHFCIEGGSLKELSNILMWMKEKIK